MRINRLSPAKVRTAGPGLHADGGGLYLQVTQGTGGLSRSWIFRYATADGRERKMGLGSCATVGLADARTKATDCRRMRLEGVDPIAARDAARAVAQAGAMKAITFEKAAEAFIASHRAGWGNVRHAKQWEVTLSTYVFPIFGKLSVSAVDTGLVMKALEPIWTMKPETASRTRGRIESVLDWAKVRGYRDGENPARWRGHLDKLFPKKSKIAKIMHHAALPFGEIGAFMAALRAKDGTAARALEFAILTAARTGEVLGARWGEADFELRTWVVPGARMKAGKEHRVPLGARAMAILQAMHAIRTGDLIFPGHHADKPLNPGALLLQLRDMGRAEVTAHGFRSCFRDWAAETTNFPNAVVEMALAHSVGNVVEAAYRRGDLFEKRRKLMDAWDAACAREVHSATVTPMRRKART